MISKMINGQEKPVSGDGGTIEYNLGTSESISLDGTIFTVPTDGYIRLYTSYGNEYYVYVDIMGASSGAFGLQQASVSFAGQAQAVFVRKGMRCRVTNYSGTVSVTFTPLSN